MFSLPKNFLQPLPLQPGDRLTVVSPSGSLRESTDLHKGVDIWRSWGYEVIFSQGYENRFGYLAGTDQQRRQDLLNAWLDPQCKGILCSRGGYGSARLLEDWQWPEISQPKWVLGFSDVTGILWSLLKSGIISLHGPVLTTLSDEPDWALERLKTYLQGLPLPSLTGKSWQSGKVQGRLVAGNLTVATHFLGTAWQPDFENVILAIEDVTEAPYRIDRMVTQWRASGNLSQVAGIALGRFSECEAPAGFPSWTVEEVLGDRLGDLGIPVVADLPFGHGGVNAILPVGSKAELDGDAGTLSFL
ncbi:S66 peptidase family protein [Synechocystis sp. CACIAM 05]|uniref:S66 peptidase family protein n=1 Tax=Synechocystis sp. CACIAM 05 TaxID=1933929 RepID=UPI00138E5687|nr:LD-carboxypeptidase [Synechocystis sp. CACIAM 05]QHV00581.1 LD-carboxypeptidase [Synechocystis sp. CACIAM 05]